MHTLYNCTPCVSCWFSFIQATGSSFCLCDINKRHETWDLPETWNPHQWLYLCELFLIESCYYVDVQLEVGAEEARMPVPSRMLWHLGLELAADQKPFNPRKQDAHTKNCTIHLYTLWHTQSLRHVKPWRTLFTLSQTEPTFETWN